MKSPKNGKSAGKDRKKAEQLKDCSTTVYNGIAEYLNQTAKTGQYAQEIKEGMLVPLQKTGKPKGPAESLRPIIL